MIVDCLEISNAIDRNTHSLIAQETDKGERRPCLGLVSFGGNAAAESYSISIERKCKSMGVELMRVSVEKYLPEEQLIDAIRSMSDNDAVDGVLVHTPLPPGISEHVFRYIDPIKDVDCANPLSRGFLFSGHTFHEPATPRAVLEILLRITELRGRHVVIFGRSNTVGKPLACMLLNKGVDATVTVLHSQSLDTSISRKADVIVCAVGKALFLKASMVREGAVVVDVGINVLSTPQGNKIVGDVDTEEVKKIASAVTPVPGGVGRVTTSVLLKNVARAYIQNLTSKRI